MSALEPYFPYIVLGGLAVAAIGLLALLIGAFRTRIWWGVGVTLILPLFGPLFAWKHPRRGLPPLAVMLLGVAVGAAPALATRLVPVDLGPRERIVDGELHLTLTGWDRKDYAFLRSKSDAVVLQMANPDVNDATLRYLDGMDGLRELDLSGTQLTDAGLRHLQGLVRLERLRLRGTAITDAGFRESLANLPALKQLDLRHTAIPQDVIDQWKAAGNGRRALR
jgi:Leucine-rich repeat (LRR) protein